MRGTIFLFLLVLSLFFTAVFGQSGRTDFYTFKSNLNKYCIEGRFDKAEPFLQEYIDFHKVLSVDERIYINLIEGYINNSLGRYDQALSSYEKASKILTGLPENPITLANVYLNMGSIFMNKNLYPQALEYYEKTRRITLQIKDESPKCKYLSLVYYGIGLVHNRQKNYVLALEYLNQSLLLNSKFHFPELGSAMVTIARVKENLGEDDEAYDYYQKGIEATVREFGNKYYRLGEMVAWYGLFLQKTGRNDESKAAFKKSLNINIGVYGRKHTLTSLANKNLGDFYLYSHNYDSAIYYYQESLISVVEDYNSMEVFSNPDPDSNKVLYYNRLLENLKSKATAFELKSSSEANKDKKIRYLNASLESIQAALRTIDILRSNYFSEENRLYLAANQKDTYLSAARILYSLYTQTGDDSYKGKLFSVSQQAKAATLSNEITGNALLMSNGIPDSLRERLKILLSEIQGYDKMIQDELSKSTPDTLKLNAMQDSRFNANREKEAIDREVSALIPQYFEMLRRIEPVDYSAIQQRLNRNETVLDYLMSPDYTNGKRKLYFFILTSNNLTIRESEVDSLFAINSGIILKTSDPSIRENKSGQGFFDYSNSLFYMYNALFRPVEDLVRNKKIIIIPDEELESLPFEAFLKNPPEKGMTDFEGLDFLINDYAFTYSYSTSFLKGRVKRYPSELVLNTFSPVYKASNGDGVRTLEGAITETNLIHQWFKGNTYSGENVTRDLFLKSTDDSAILHLALHTMTDTVNSKFSYMLFNNGSIDDGRLYNYEISLDMMKSPMVVLSSCNSGIGTLHSGAGLMSIARSFFLSGASSVVKTSWEVNDESGSEIIVKFYHYLSKGRSKDDALRLAKLDFIRKSPPALSNPYYWAAYSVLGDSGPVCRNRTTALIIISMLVIITAGGLFYFRRRRIF